MEKYTTYKNIRKEDIQAFKGLSKEVKTSVMPSFNILPFEVSTFGITYPDPEYYIKRFPTRCFILEYIVSGKGTVINNGHVFTLEANDVYLIHPGDYCEYYSDKKEPYEKYWINFTSNIVSDMLKAYNIHDKTVFRNINLQEEFAKIYKLDNSPCINDDIYIDMSSIMFQIIMKLAKCYTNENIPSELAQSIKYKLAYAVNQSFSLDDCCKDLYVSKSQVIREFKKYYHITPYQYLLNARIELSKNLLLNTQKSIKEISQMLCFSNEYNFSNYFKQKEGISPKQFRIQKNF